MISDIYFDKSGYGSKAITLKDARQKDKTITADEVKEFFKKNVEEKRNQEGRIVLLLHMLTGNFNWIYFYFKK